jgi:hypothetical protein
MSKTEAAAYVGIMTANEGVIKHCSAQNLFLREELFRLGLRPAPKRGHVRVFDQSDGYCEHFRAAGTNADLIRSFQKDLTCNVLSGIKAEGSSSDIEAPPA